MAPAALVAPASAGDYPELVRLWEASVRATHHFLAETDIQYYRSCLARDFFPAVMLYCIRQDARIAAFSGVAARKVEMLFVHPDCQGQGLGKMLLNHAVQTAGARLVDVNEQNEAALRFYQKMGYEITGRSPVDGSAKPYPILHLRLP